MHKAESQATFTSLAFGTLRARIKDQRAKKQFGQQGGVGMSAETEATIANVRPANNNSLLSMGSNLLEVF
jgi:hypothetical protein